MKKIICYGDSNTYGYDPRSYLEDRYPANCRWPELLAAQGGWAVRNDGLNGRVIPRSALSFPPDTDLLIVMLGTNDLLHGSAPEAAAERMGAFLGALPLERTSVLLLAPPPLKRGEWVTDAALLEASRALAGCFRELADRLGVSFADAGAWDIDLAYDGVHFSEEGHRTFARQLLPLVAKRFGE